MTLEVNLLEIAPELMKLAKRSTNEKISLENVKLNMIVAFCTNGVRHKALREMFIIK